MDTNEILVVGAGAAGLMAGCELVEKGFKVTIVEARDRIGGRICTVTNGFSAPVDIGAEFVHGDKKMTNALLKEAGLKLLRLKGEMYNVENGAVKESNFFDEDWGKVVKKLKELSHDMDMATFMDVHFNKKQYPDLYENVRGFIEGYDAADFHRVSAMALREEWSGTDDERQFHIEGGYGKLMEYLAEKFRSLGGTIRLSCPVKEIHWSEGFVEIVTEDRQKVIGSKAVITAPLGVLMHDGILFFPRLAEHQKAFARIGFGGVIKFIIEFDDTFWKPMQQNAGLHDLAFVFSDCLIPTWWSQLPKETPLITGWLGGPQTNHISHDPDELFNVATASLGSIFKLSATEIKSNVRHWRIADWVKDPYSMGAYSFPTVHTKEARTLLSQPVRTTLYFAGEAIFDGADMGTVEAALVSGRDVAQTIAGERNEQ
jgi:monoamine oxidase